MTPLRILIQPEFHEIHFNVLNMSGMVLESFLRAVYHRRCKKFLMKVVLTILVWKISKRGGWKCEFLNSSWKKGSFINDVQYLRRVWVCMTKEFFVYENKGGRGLKIQVIYVRLPCKLRKFLKIEGLCSPWPVAKQEWRKIQ